MRRSDEGAGTAYVGLRDHPQRAVIAAELHARPFESLSAPLQATHLAMIGGDPESDRAHVAKLCETYEQVQPPAGSTHHSADMGGFRLRWERHTEFSTYTFFTGDHVADANDPFAHPPLNRLPGEWLENIHGELVSGMHLVMESPDAPERKVADILELFGTENVAGSSVADDGALLYTDFRLHADGFGRALIQVRDLPPRRTGRLVQRLLEIETYRLMALLAFPLARQTTSELTRLEGRLQNITDRMTRRAGLEDEQALLSELSDVAGELERMSALNSFRLGAARAYRQLVEHRIRNLRERRLKGLQTISEFMERRFTPAMRTCEYVNERQAALSQRLSRAADLLRTRVDVALEAQNRDLLTSMNKRTELQLRLQQTVEGLSVVVLSYYSTGLLAYALRGVEAAGVRLNVSLIVGAAVPFIVLGVWTVTRRLRRRLLTSREREHT